MRIKIKRKKPFKYLLNNYLVNFYLKNIFYTYIYGEKK
jgi:hypothetical protein